MEAAGGAGARRSQRDKERAAYLKSIGDERRSGRCPICYELIPNDTFGGFGAASHLSRCTRPTKKHRSLHKQ
jgi:hypothetical protein